MTGKFCIASISNRLHRCPNLNSVVSNYSFSLVRNRDLSFCAGAPASLSLVHLTQTDFPEPCFGGQHYASSSTASCPFSFPRCNGSAWPDISRNCIRRRDRRHRREIG